MGIKEKLTRAARSAGRAGRSAYNVARKTIAPTEKEQIEANRRKIRAAKRDRNLRYARQASMKLQTAELEERAKQAIAKKIIRESSGYGGGGGPLAGGSNIGNLSMFDMSAPAGKWKQAGSTFAGPDLSMFEMYPSQQPRNPAHARRRKTN